MAKVEEAEEFLESSDDEEAQVVHFGILRKVAGC